MNPFFWFICLALAVTPRGWSIPVTFHFQGHLLVDGAAFEGTAYFKFALLDGDGAIRWANAGVDSNDEPEGSVALEMARGVYSVALGETAISGMAAIDPSVFDADSLALRVWFSTAEDGTFEQLSPDNPLGSVAFAARAATADTVTALPEAIVTTESLSAELQDLLSRVAVISTDPDDSSLESLGFDRFLSLEADEWRAGATVDAPLGRTGHTAVWTGAEWMVWGGRAGARRYLDSGGIYNASSDLWSLISPVNAPTARSDCMSVWDGSRMLVWGGRDRDGRLATGGVFDPSTGGWSRMTSDGAPAERDGALAFWSGTRMFVWGGENGQGYPLDGGLYDPESDSWEIVENFYSLSASHEREPSILWEIVDPEDSGSANWVDGLNETAPFLEGGLGVSAADGYVYVAAGADDALSIFDVRDPANPVLAYSLLYQNSSNDAVREIAEGVGFVSNFNAVYEVEPYGNLLAASSGASGALSFFDVSDRTAPRRLSFITDTDGDSSQDYYYFDRPRKVRFAGTLAFVGVDELDFVDDERDRPAALYIVDIADPESPEFVARWVDGDTIPTADGGNAILEFGGAVNLDINPLDDQTVVYLASSTQPYLYVLDASDPTNLVQVDRLEDGVESAYLGAAASVLYHDERAALFVGSSGGEDAVNIFDATNPTALELKTTIHKSDGIFSLLDWPNGLAAEGDVLTVSGGNSDGLTLVDISQLDAPELIAGYKHNDGFANVLDGPRGAAIYGGIAYTVTWDSNSVVAVEVETFPSVRSGATGMAAGDEFLVWGGQNETGSLADGFALSFTEEGTVGSWRWLSEEDAPSARHGHTAVWTGSEMVVWGGEANGEWLDDGARYDPATDTWSPLPAVAEESDFLIDEDTYGLVGRRDHVAVWTGTEMVVFGGTTASGQTADAFAYDPALGTYRLLPGGGVIEPRRNATAVWTGEEILLFGGFSGSQRIGALRRLDPDPSLHLFRKP